MHDRDTNAEGLRLAVVTYEEVLRELAPWVWPQASIDHDLSSEQAL
jgi:hypothetical protein